MTTSLINIYLSINVLLMVTALCIFALSRLRKVMTYSALRKLALLLLAMSFATPILVATCPPDFEMAPAAQVWSAPSMKFDQPAPSTSLGFHSSDRDVPSATSVDSDHWIVFLLSLMLIPMFVLGLRFLSGVTTLQVIRKQATLLHRFRTVEILISDKISIPCCMWLPRQNLILLPSFMGEAPENIAVAIAHEAQHLRHGDHVWNVWMQLLGIAFWWNPGVFIFRKKFSDLQEFACDESVAGHYGIDPIQYSRCLLWVAENALRIPPSWSGATMVGFDSSRHSLKRRIEHMLTQPRVRAKKLHVAMSFGATTAAMALAAFLTSGAVKDRRISMSEAQEFIARSQSSGEFPLYVNERILAELNRFAATPDGRRYMRESIRRGQEFQEVISAKIRQYHLPDELAAVPVIESGYRNLPPRRDRGVGAGLWMFIKQTARHYGLLVNDEIDERLNVEKETDAAMRYLGSVHLKFQDWGLALLAYNTGENAVQKAIDETGEREPFKLIEAGYENDRGYLAKVMAAVLIMKNPQWIN